MEPLDDNTLAELAKTNPDLVAQYRAKMQPSTDGNVANVAGKALNEFGNANRPKDAILYNRMDSLGKAPTISATPERAYDDKPINNATGQMVARAEEDKGNAQNTFNEEQKLTDSQRSRTQQDAVQGQQKKGWDVENARNDPTGAQAKQAGLLLKNALLSKASEADEAGRQGVPGASDAAKQLREQAKTAGDGMGAGDIMQQAKLIPDTSYDKVLEMKVKKSNIDANREYRQGQIDDRADRKQSESTQKMRKDLETFRGNPAAAQAGKDVLSADKAVNYVKKKLASGQPISRQELALQIDEMEKIATGGSGTEAGRIELTPDNASTAFAAIKEKITSAPTDAAAAEYVRNNIAYIEDMKNTAQKAITSYRTGLAKGYKNLVSPQDYQDALDDYGLEGGKAKAAPPEAPMPAAAAPAAPAVAPDVAKYAQAHGITVEQAQAIKDARSK
jgi:hypothetical protein